eukprot:1717558-Rhodomonas_salina.2
MEGICLEAQLRKAALAKLECKLDDIYEDEPIDFTDQVAPCPRTLCGALGAEGVCGGQDSMAMHAASGMRVTSGASPTAPPCPAARCRG